MCCFSVPFTPIQSFTGKWLFGEVLCTLFPVSQGISIYISTMTMTIIALDRFVVVCYPYRQRMQVGRSFFTREALLKWRASSVRLTFFYELWPMS
jgi:7 transmembrane receptor (rhodopsin family)